VDGRWREVGPCRAGGAELGSRLLQATQARPSPGERQSGVGRPWLLLCEIRDESWVLPGRPSPGVGGPFTPHPTPCSRAVRSMKLSSDRLVFCRLPACRPPAEVLPGAFAARSCQASRARPHRGPANRPASRRVSERGDRAGWAAAARAWALSAVERAAWGRTFAQLRVPEPPPPLGDPCWREGACPRWGGGEPH
jgi:hypothetical protein